MGDSTSTSSSFRVNSELVGHDGAVRAICRLTNDVLVTGAMDTSVLSWIRDGQSYIELLSARLYGHEHWVTALLALPTGGFVTGSMDKAIRVFSADATLQTILRGHEGGVISLALSADGTHLVSGSWDGSARVWDLHTSQCVHTMTGHENGACVLALPDGTIVTGSTGRQVGNTVVDFQLRFWKDWKLVKTMQDHSGPIRQLALIPDLGFVSCSNDGSIRVRMMDGEVIAMMQHPMNAEGKPGFVLGVAVLPDNRIVSASEDCTARVWTINGVLHQTIEHPGGLWCVAALPNGDFVTGCDDKIARIFTTDPTRVSDTAQACFEAAVAEALLVRERGPSGVEIAKLPDYERRFDIVGKSDGQIQMFRKGTTAWACQWSNPSRTWIDIGEVTGTGSGGVVDGKAYDMVIPVEIEQPGGVRHLEIGYNQGDNPFMVAQEFINQHMLDQSYLREIADYITQRSGDYRAPVIGVDAGANGTRESTSTNDVVTSRPTFTYFPVASYHSFETTKISKLMNTVRQFNDKVPEGLKLHDTELSWLETTSKTVQETAFYHSSTFTPSETGVLVAAISRWSSEQVFPLLDLLRLVVAHPQGPVVLGDATMSKIIDLSLQFATNPSSDVPNATRMLALRILSNMFTHKNARDVIIAKKDKIVSALPTCVIYLHKTVALSSSTLLLNLARLHLDNTALFSTDDVVTIGSAAMNIVVSAPSLAELGEDTALRALVAVGTLAWQSDQEVKDAFASLVNVFSASKNQQTAAITAVSACLDELRHCVGLV